MGVLCRLFPFTLSSTCNISNFILLNLSFHFPSMKIPSVYPGLLASGSDALPFHPFLCSYIFFIASSFLHVEQKGGVEVRRSQTHTVASITKGASKDKISRRKTTAFWGVGGSESSKSRSFPRHGYTGHA